MEHIDLAPGYTIARMIKGGWELSSGHSDTLSGEPLDDMTAFLDAGITVFDCADIYTGVEELIGRFVERLRRERGTEAAAQLKIQTKFVPDLDVLGHIDRAYVNGIVERSLQRLKVERLDLVQFHWWDLTIPGAAKTAALLVELQQTGKIDRLAGCNFDSSELSELVASGFPAIANQVQFSLIDQRPAMKATDELNIGMLCYGVLAGGFLSERWLGIAPPREPFETRSQLKYFLVIEEFGGWSLFQQLLAALQSVARRHAVGIANVATRWVLDQPGVAAVIIGARHANQLQDNLRTFALRLEEDDHIAIDAVLSRRRGPTGRVFELERDRRGRHGSIMAYNLNAARRVS